MRQKRALPQVQRRSLYRPRALLFHLPLAVPLHTCTCTCVAVRVKLGDAELTAAILLLDKLACGATEDISAAHAEV